MKKENIISPYCNTLKFKTQELSPDEVQQLLQVAIVSTQNPENNTCEFYVTDDTDLLEKLADVRDYGSKNIKNAPMAVAVVADRLYDGAWIENCSSAVWAISCKAAELELGCEAVQIRGYTLSDGVLSDDAVRGILGIPDGKTVFALLAIGYVDLSPKHANDEAELDWGKVHIV